MIATQAAPSKYSAQCPLFLALLLLILEIDIVEGGERVNVRYTKSRRRRGDEYTNVVDALRSFNLSPVDVSNWRELF